MLQKILAITLLLLTTTVGCNRKEDPEKIRLSAMVELANRGNAEAQNWMAIQYNDGSKFIKKDRDLFYQWVRKSADQGYAEAQFSLATALLNDKKDMREVVDWYNKCASAGEGKWQSEALVALANLTFDGVNTGYDDATVYGLITKAALQNNQAACHVLGVFILSKSTDIETFYIAKSFLEKSSTSGFAKSQYVLGLLYWKSKYLGHDFQAAFELIKKAALQGYPEAQLVYSEMLQNGIGIQIDQVGAKAYKEKALNSGFNGKLFFEKIKIP